jgi:uncharacterized protein DUF3551
MMRKSILIALTLIALTGAAAIATPAAASPFCVQVTGLPLQCLYADPAICQREADRQGGRCTANPEEFKTPAGGLGFCVVQSGNVPNCIYPDLASCSAEAKRTKSACIAATPTTLPKAVDPYEVKRPY